MTNNLNEATIRLATLTRKALDISEDPKMDNPRKLAAEEARP